MTVGSSEEDADARPQVAGWFVAPDEMANPLLVVIGRVVFTATGLEKALQLGLMRLLLARVAVGGEAPSAALGKEIARLQR